MTSQISREILVAMLVFHIFQDGGKSPERHGNNLDPHVKKRSLWKDFLRCYRPTLTLDKACDLDCLPRVESMDLLSL